MKKLIITMLAAAMLLTSAPAVLAAPADNDETVAPSATTAPEATQKPDDNDDDTPEATQKPASKTKTASKVSFSDINESNFAWAKPYIVDMAELGLISGYEDGTYRPDNDVTRLEAISLFARAMGSVDEVNKPVLEIAHERYDNVIKNYNLSWGKDEVAFMMYKGALNKTDLDTYLKDDEKNTPMKRYEAAIIITKAMGGEETALSDPGVVLGYNDSREVPANAIQYVSYVTDNTIMEGMDDGSFSPNTPVKRSQMAVMLSRTVNKTDYSFKKVKLEAVDTAGMEITVTDENDKETEYAYNDGTSFKVIGDEAQAKDLPVGVDAVMTLSGKKLTALDTVSEEPDRTVTGKYVSYATTTGRTTLKVTVDETNEQESFECDPDISVTYEGSPATVRSFTKGDVVELNIHNGKVVKLTGETKTTTISGAIVEDVDISDGVKITISHGDSQYNGKTYDVSSDVKVKKNDATLALDSIYPGDKVKLTLEYGVITSIVATSSTKTVEGTIRSLTIASPQSTMTVKVKDEEIDYVIPSSVEILINGSEGSLYDFRVGDLVKITVESEAIKKIVATSTQESSGSISGVVTAVNSSYGVVSIKPEGSEDAKQVFCKDDQTTFVTADGKTKKMKDIKVGQTVEAKGTVSNGVFVGKLLIIVSE